MNEIKSTIEPTDVEWLMPAWKSGEKEYPDEMIFEHPAALAHLLINEIVFINSRWWEKDLPERIQKAIGLYVNCNDVFAWACADGEELPYEQIEPLYRLWKADPEWGIIRWCCLQRKQRPQDPIKREMEKAGAWDAEMEALPDNRYWASIRAKDGKSWLERIADSAEGGQ